MHSRIFLILLLCLMTGCGNNIEKWPKVPFDQQKWLQTKDIERFVFVRDLIEGEKLKGKTIDEVLTLLGSPSYKSEDGSYTTYIVKAESGNLYILDIRFKVAGRKVVDILGVRSD